MKTKFLIVSDIHNNEQNVNDLIKIINPDIVLDCGDHTEDDSFYKPKSIPWYFISGNHENEEKIKNLMFGIENIYNLYLIKPGDLISINGINIAGFGGNYSDKTYNNQNFKYSDNNYKKSKKNKKNNSFFHITKNDVKMMENMSNKKKLVDILLMHESSKELWEGTKYNFGQNINSYVVSLFPNLKYVISGHYHISNSKTIKNNNGTHRNEISLNTPEEFNYIVLEGKDRKLEIKEIQNETSYKKLYFFQKNLY